MHNCAVGPNMKMYLSQGIVEGILVEGDGLGRERVQQLVKS